MFLERLKSIDETKQECLEKLRAKELKLYSAEVQAKFKDKSDEVKKAFLQERTDYTVARVTLENVTLEKIAGQLERLAPDLQSGIENLNNELESLASTISILNAISRVTGIVARILLLV